MICSACGHDVPDGSAFCNGCGAKLVRTCASCGATPPPGSRFCNGCGADLQAGAPAPAREPRAYTPKHLADKILQSKSALEGERKQVTVLFADVKGSMELAEQLDAEEFGTIMQRFFRILAEGVERFEGFVDKFTGDGIMALFGAPIAHEDHAQRACYAALHLRSELAHYATEVKRAHGVGFSTRLGIHSGEVLVGTIGDDLRMDYTAQGHTVGLAQRMEALASPDSCYLTGTTAGLVRGYFELEDLGDFQIKGVQAPVRVHRLVGAGAARTRFEVSRSRGLTRFVGRDADMSTLEAALGEAQAGHGQVVGVVAEAGTGKSRLCFEFAQHCRARGMTVNEGHAVAHGKNIPYLPMLQVFRGYYGITEQDDDRTVREKIAGRMLLLDETFRDVLPVLFEFFGVPDPDRPVPRMDPEAKQRQIFAVLRRLVQGADPRGGARSFATLIEDLHWMDPGSEVFLEQWVDAIAGASSFLLLNFRPEYHAAWMQKSYYRQLPLAPLGAEAIRKLLDDLLGHDPSTRDLAEAIHARTGGNPFFTEEVVQTLIESGNLQGTRGGYRLVTPIERLAVPVSVEAVLAARIDRLPEREKQVLQAAAVIGKEFAEPILVAAAELPASEVRAALATLKTNEFVYEQALYPVAEYAFKHPLTQEVALGSQLQERRRRTHATVARAIEAAYPAKLDEQAALLAHHWEAAGEALAAAHWHRRAAEWVAISDMAEAQRHWEKVRALVATLPESPATLALGVAAHVELVNLSWRLGIESQKTAVVFEAGRMLAKRAHDARSLALLLSSYSIGGGHDADRAFAYYTEAVRLASQTGDTALRVAVGCMLGPHALNGRLREALQRAEQVLDLAGGDPRTGEALVHFNAVAWLFTLEGFVKSHLGRVDEGMRDFDRAAQLVAQYGESVDHLVFHQYRAWTARLCGEVKLTMDHARRAVEYADRAGGPFWEWQVWGVLGQAHALNSAWDEAIPLLEQAVAAERRLALRFGFFAPQLAAGYLEQGAQQRASALVGETITTAQSGGFKLTELEAQLVRAGMLVRTESASAGSAAEAAISRAEALAQETGACIYLPQILLARAELAGAQGDDGRRQTLRRDAHRLFVEMGATGYAARLTPQLAS